MEDNRGLACIVCFNFYLADPPPTPGQVDRRPATICQNGHSLCMACAKYLLGNEEEERSPCPTCREELLTKPIINRALIEAVDSFAQKVSKVPNINIKELKMASASFARGAYADVYHAKWHSQDVVIKALRPASELNQQLKLLQLEANLAIGLHHPNIIRVFGTTTTADNRFGIVMEKADQGSLCEHMQMERQCAVQVSLGVIDGLDYVHSRKIAHRDLKPQNILLVGAVEIIAKIADFGVSKVIQTLVTTAQMVGTPKYAPPELLEPGTSYGCSADIYSLTIMLFELFSGQAAEDGLGTNPMQIMLAVVRGRRPKIPSTFPPVLRPLIERGWKQEANQRPTLSEFRAALQSMVVETRKPEVKYPQRDSRITMEEQSREVAKVNLPVPMISLQWNSSCELLDSAELRPKMVSDIFSASNMSKVINAAVRTAMRVTPRHLFIDTKRLAGFIGSEQRPITSRDIVDAAYKYNKAMPATEWSNESSPEIIGTQLSLTEILPGQSVLLVGIKGGYIQSLVSQLVGMHGSVVTMTSHKSAMSVCRDRVDVQCPLKDVVRWSVVEDITNPQNIISAVQRDHFLFHTVIYCGAVDKFPNELTAILHPSGNASIMAPVTDSSKSQRFQLWQRRDGECELRTITNFGVIFEGIH